MLDQVADLLAQSWVAHEQARACLKQHDRGGAVVLWKEARAHRQAAHELDPGHTSPAWAIEQKKTPNGEDTHRMLQHYYNRQIDREVVV
jgi:hypothetical protein